MVEFSELNLKIMFLNSIYDILLAVIFFIILECIVYGINKAIALFKHITN